MLTKFLVAATVLVSTYAQTVVDIVSGESDLSILTTQLTDNGLVSVLSGDGPYTVLAPTDTAFGLITLPSVVTEILKYHVINANVASTDLTSGLVATTLEAAGQTVTAYLNNNMAYFYDSKGGLAQVTVADLTATNGVVHKIDAVLIPDGTIDDITGGVADLSSLDGALAANGLDTTLQGTGPFTLFAPSNAAVAAFNGEITSDVLTYHVVATKYLAADVPTTATALTTVQGATITVIRDESTGAVTITDAAGMVSTVTIANIAGTNGVVHIVDTVLEYRDVVGLASDRSDLSTLVSALGTANLVGTLQGDGPYTVLAPTDTAFGLITVPSGDALTQVLLYHVLGSKVLSTDLSSGLVATTLQEDSQTVTAQLAGGASFYDSNGRVAMVTVADIVGSNGVIHVIDAVLLPDGTVDDITGNVADLSSLDGALAANSLDATLADTASEFTLFAPSNTAVAAFSGTITSDLLLNHVIAAKYLAADVPTTPTKLTTATGGILTVVRDGSTGAVTVTDAAGTVATVTTANIAGTNGVVHMIDTVLELGTISQLVELNADLSTLYGALAANALNNTLNGAGPFTLFAPSNDAVSAFNGAITSNVLTYHVVGTKYLAADVPETATDLTTVNTATISVIRAGDVVTITDAAGIVATVTTANIVASNGVIHIIDSVLEYRDVVGLAQDRSDLSTLVSALGTANLVTTLQEDGPYTVLAPTDTAFGLITVPTGDALTQVLLYHVLGSAVYASDLSSGLVATTLQADSQTVTAQLAGGASFYDSNGRIAMVTVADIVGSNGVIHVIDAVLLPDGTVDDITGNVADLSSLDGALAANGLDATLADTASEFTLFAPSNTAIAAVSGVDITSEILTYHVVATKYLSTAVPTTATDLTTVQGETLSVIRDEATGGVTVTDANGNTATVTVANIAGKNGVVHIIDSVILPFVSSEPTMMPTMSPTEDTSGAFAHSAIISLIVGAFVALV